jgi:hypothetical protein
LAATDRLAPEQRALRLPTQRRWAREAEIADDPQISLALSQNDIEGQARRFRLMDFKLGMLANRWH